MTGKLITFEGGEGAGKTSLIEALFSFLTKEGRAVLKTRAPGGTKTGLAIRDLLLHAKEISLVPRAELLLFLADRSQHVEEVILPALQTNTIVLCDRFNDSTVAYQGEGRGFGREKIQELTAFASSSLLPHLTLYLDVDPIVGLKRAQGSSQSIDKIESEEITFHQKIRTAFHQIAKEEPSRFRIIDASQPREHVLKQALEMILPIL